MIIFWILGSFVVGFLGSDRKIGFWSSFFLSLILSPFIGLLITLFSETKISIARKKKQLKLQEETLKATKEFNKTKEQRLQELNVLKEKGLISEKEYIESRKNIISN